MGFASKRMMKLALVLLALAAVDAHMTEPDTYALSIPAPPGEDDALAMIDEGAGAVTKYRVTWQTKADECTGNKCAGIKATNEKYASNGSFKLTVTTTTKMDQSWTPAFVKINTNNKYTGLGSGVYYVPIGRAIYDKDDFEAKTAPGDGERKMTKCEAQFCEEEMDKKLKLSQ